MDIPKHIRDAIANPPAATTPTTGVPSHKTILHTADTTKLTHHEDFVMRMFFMRYPKNMDWKFCMHLITEGKEDAYFTRWFPYQNLHIDDLMGEMESMLADLKHEFTSMRITLPSPLSPAATNPDPNADLSAWELITRTINPLNK